MRVLGVFLISFGLLLIFNELINWFRLTAKWNAIQPLGHGKRVVSGRGSSDWISRIGKRYESVIPVRVRKSLKNLLIRSGMHDGGQAEQFLGLSSVLWLLAAGSLLLSGMLSFRFQNGLFVGLGSGLALMLLAAPLLAVYAAHSKRSDQILRDIPLLVLSVRRELIREANFIEAFLKAENALHGVLRDEIQRLNQYVQSTKGDFRTGLNEFQNRCGQRAIDLFCMTIRQGMDTGHVVEGLTELELQMQGILRDRIQKQTEKRNLLMFFGTMMAASILLLQGSFYGLMKLREQMSNLPF